MNRSLFTIILALSATSAGLCQTSYWSNSPIPGTPEVTYTTSSVTLGLQFYSDVPGSVTAVRFYKGPHNIGTHIGTLWSSGGTKLAEITFSGETASGWQQANFSAPISIAANTPYVISYLAPQGNYAYDPLYSWSTLNAAPLHVPNSSPGVYSFGSGVLFPTRSYSAGNYWVDLVFVPAGSSIPSTTYNITGNISGSAAKVTLSGTVSGLMNTDSSGNYTFSGLQNGSYVIAPSQSGYTFTPSTASVSINGASKAGVNFTATAVQPPVSHSITLTWTSSTSPSISGYNVYRANVSGGPYTMLNASPIATTSYLDSRVASGQTYFYAATTVQSTTESTYSTQATAVVPTP